MHFTSGGGVVDGVGDVDGAVVELFDGAVVVVAFDVGVEVLGLAVDVVGVVVYLEVVEVVVSFGLSVGLDDS